MLQTPEVIVRTWLAARDMEAGGSATNPIGPSITEAEVRSALIQLDPLWDELFPAEQARIVQLLISRVDVTPDGVSISLRTDGMATLVADMGTRKPAQAPQTTQPKQTRLEHAA